MRTAGGAVRRRGGKIATLVHGASRVVTKDELTHSEAAAYLDMADGDVDRAITNVREDFGWSAEEEGKIETVIAGTSGASSSSSSPSSRIVTTGGDRHRGLTYSEARACLLDDGRLGRGRRSRYHPRGLRHVLRLGRRILRSRGVVNIMVEMIIRME